MGNWPLLLLLIGVAGANIGVNGADVSRAAASLLFLIPLTLATYLLVRHQLAETGRRPLRRARIRHDAGRA